MRSYLPRTLALMLALPATLASAACVSAPAIQVTTVAGSCSKLIPDDWTAGVPGAPLPKDNTLGQWVAFADGQTGQLDKANGRTKDSLAILRACEARDAEVVKQLTRRSLWQKMTPWRDG